MEMISVADTPGISTSAKPTELREVTGTPGLATCTPVMVTRRVVKVRDGNVTTWPGGVRDAAPRGTETGSRPSKVMVTLEIVRSGSPVWGWTRVSDVSVCGWVRTTCHHCPSGGAKESSTHAVWVLPSMALNGRSSGR